MVGTHQVCQVSRDKCYRQIFLEGCVYFRLPREMVAHRLSTVGGVLRSPQVVTHRCSVTPAQHLQSLEEVTEITLGDYPDPDLEVFLIQQRERFKRSLARVHLLDIPEISWLGAVARLQARTSTALVRHEQHKRFQQWALHVNGPNVARSLCHAKFPLREVSHGGA